MKLKDSPRTGEADQLNLLKKENANYDVVGLQSHMFTGSNGHFLKNRLGDRCGSGNTNSGQGQMCGRTAGQTCYDEEIKTCNEDICSVTCQWSYWSEWGSCTPDCAEGTRIRRRSNNEDQGAFCDQPKLESKPCDINSVPFGDCFDRQEFLH